MPIFESTPSAIKPEVYDIAKDNYSTYWRSHVLGIEAASLLVQNLSDEYGPAFTEFIAFTLEQEAEKSNLRADKERLIQLSNTDPLTGLFNRRGAEHAYKGLSGYGNLNERRQTPQIPVNAHVLVLDLDDFKSVNETFGHQAGDDLLVQVGSSMVSKTRSNDIIARWGGDEFVILLPRTPKARAEEIANNIRKEINQKTRTTVSIGVGQVDYRLSLEETINLADHALAQAKQTGKNIVVNLEDMTIDVTDSNIKTR